MNSTLTPVAAAAGPATETRVPTPAALPAAEYSVRAMKRIQAALLAIAGVFFALHFVRLRADFPNHSPWMDWAKYTDEGWYGDAAIRHYQLGHWYAPGDFNPAVALPVWPAIELAFFRFTGVSLVAARALTVVVFGLILACCYLLIRRWPGALVEGSRGEGAARARSLAPSLAVLLLAVSPYCFALMRLAILEPLLVLLALAALLVASAAGPAAARAWRGEAFAIGGSAERSRLQRRAIAWSVLLGLMLPLIALTKTTGIFIFPAILFLLWAATGYRLRPWLYCALIAAATGAALWGGYFLLFVRPRYLIDYRYLFSANAYTGITSDTFWSVLQDAITDASWIGATLSVLALLAVVAGMVTLGVRRRRGNPLAAALLLWILSYGGFVAYHANLQPRYYLVLAVPLTMLVAMVFDALLSFALAARREREAEGRMRGGAIALQITAAISAAALLFAIFNGARQTIDYVLHPEYSFVSAATQLRDTIDRETAEHPGHSRLLLSISGADFSLMTGLPSICDDFGTMTLPDRVAAYRPGWFATWNDVEDDKMEALAPLYRLVRVGEWPAFDDPDRNLLILYRLDALPTPGPPGRPGRRRSLSVPHRLRTKVGEQPTVLQLKH
jgi:4-amino-4-deoxy-L-arabinose transferase-like glycosyltransferase